MPERIHSFDKDDRIPLQYLAAAMLAHWTEIPLSVRSKIKGTAVMGKIVGLPPTTALHEQISHLTRRSETKSS